MPAPRYRCRQLLNGLDPAAARIPGHLLRWLERRTAALSGRDETRAELDPYCPPDKTAP